MIAIASQTPIRKKSINKYKWIRTSTPEEQRLPADDASSGSTFFKREDFASVSSISIINHLNQVSSKIDVDEFGNETFSLKIEPEPQSAVKCNRNQVEIMRPQKGKKRKNLCLPCNEEEIMQQKFQEPPQPQPSQQPPPPPPSWIEIRQFFQHEFYHFPALDANFDPIILKRLLRLIVHASWQINWQRSSPASSASSSSPSPLIEPPHHHPPAPFYPDELFSVSFHKLSARLRQEFVHFSRSEYTLENLIEFLKGTIVKISKACFLGGHHVCSPPGPLFCSYCRVRTTHQIADCPVRRDRLCFDCFEFHHFCRCFSLA